MTKKFIKNLYYQVDKLDFCIIGTLVSNKKLVRFEKYKGEDGEIIIKYKVFKAVKE